ncbi:DUF3298 and DUF4163 domain-containing protein [Alkalihalobacillus sp. AL-G]|uniref:DUF3298 and DUF4163 domain-containing protein n=1 Tax=Alkalihalobacillus sp. AL-G TaxID=2926399 RepID=UPI00272B18BB|nr:DUF3298 and DUF4163 domain-containing protein [Alkalihalobacillus sp. AL-G]WLD91530.1 DUF3298 and DUF4163 domain-containing protein [Alkalihalobacillus sp. AL-G]
MYDVISPVQVITITVEKPGTKVKYPKLVCMDDRDVGININKQILLLVQRLREEGDQPNTTVSITYTIKVNKNGVLSVIFLLDYYTAGAAHGMQVQKALTFSTINGTCFPFPSLFRMNSYYKTRLSRYAKAYIKSENITLIEEYKGITDEQEYYLTNDTLVLFYQLYEYTPYAYGFLEIPVPFEVVQTLVDKKSPIAQLTSR